MFNSNVIANDEKLAFIFTALNSAKENIIYANYKDFISKNNLTESEFFNEINAVGGEFAIDFNPVDYHDWVYAKLTAQRPFLAGLMLGKSQSLYQPQTPQVPLKANL